MTGVQSGCDRQGHGSGIWNGIRQSHNYFLRGRGAMILSERTVRLVKVKIA